jgi:hypothetical protein
VNGSRLTEQQIQAVVREVIANAKQREESYLPRAGHLTDTQKKLMRPFFPEKLLEQVRVLELKQERMPNPEYQRTAMRRGYRFMIDFSHMADITHPQLIIFQESLTPRLLFHALVHVTQYAVLGLERYLDIYVRAFMATGIYTSVPFEVQAFRLDERFSANPEKPFFVEAEVRQWAEKGNYLVSEQGGRRHGT